MKRKVTIENAFQIEPYRSILNLLIRFQKYGEPGGLKQSHFRYALMDNHGDLNPYLKEKMKHFYIWTDGINRNDALQQFREEGHIKSNCITSRSNLSNKLKKLEDLGLIHKDLRGKQDRYKITRDCNLKGIHILNKKTTDQYRNLFVHKSDEYYHILYGISTNIFYKIDESDRSILLENLKKIEELLIEIQNMKLEPMCNDWSEILQTLIPDIKGKEVEFTKTIIQLINEGEPTNTIYSQMDKILIQKCKTEFQKLLEKYEIGISYSWFKTDYIDPFRKIFE